MNTKNIHVLEIYTIYLSTIYKHMYNVTRKKLVPVMGVPKGGASRALAPPEIFSNITGEGRCPPPELLVE